MKAFHRVRKAIFPVAGLGTRFLPATKALPKEMLPVVDKPVIQYIVEEALAAGLTDIVFITGRGKEAIENHFDVSLELERILEERQELEKLQVVRDTSNMVHVAYVRQKVPQGLGHAVLCAAPFVDDDEPFAVLLGDDLIVADVPAIQPLIAWSQEAQAPVIGVQPVPESEVSAYGVIDGVPVHGGIYRVRGLVEKPSPEAAPSRLAIIGRYVLHHDIFRYIEATPPDTRGEIQLTDALQAWVQDGRPLYAVEIRGRRYDTGSKLGFLQANIELGLQHPDVGPALQVYLRALLRRIAPE
ncbi:UTP--glucose-1-phosphate uridylyltransferase [bacterium HR11]|nr:UTP--glucose-1-phosphate uridylyltransferase [bacterium HR11]